MAPKCRAELLSSVTKHKKPVICFTEKTHVLDKLCSSMSYSAVGRDFNVNESAIHTK